MTSSTQEKVMKNNNLSTKLSEYISVTSTNIKDKLCTFLIMLIILYILLKINSTMDWPQSSKFQELQICGYQMLQLLI